MSDNNQHFKIVKHKDYLFVIQEDISIVQYSQNIRNFYGRSYFTIREHNEKFW